MSHAKSCRCKICLSNDSPDCDSCYPDCCSYHWKNRFCKLRKQWSPCDKTVGRFGVAWVAEIPDCDNGEPKGWQVEIKDTTQGILKKCKELIEWLNNPPAHLFDNIEGNEKFCNIRYPKCNPTICSQSKDEPLKEIPYECNNIRPPKKCRIKCCDEEIIQYHPCCNNPPVFSKDQKCSKQNRCCREYQICDECSDPKNLNSIKKCQNKPCINHRLCDELSDQDIPCGFTDHRGKKCYEDHRTCDDFSDQKTSSCVKRCKIKCCQDKRTYDDFSDKESSNCTKQCKSEICKGRPRYEDCSDREKPNVRHPKCRWSAPITNEYDVFRKESCCCHCHQKLFKNTGTTYEIDIVPQKENTIRPTTSEMSELDSKIICAGVRTSQICKKMMEEKRNQLMEKRERELNTVIADKSSDDEASKNLYISAVAENQSVINNSLMENSLSSQRRSSKFRRKESG